MKNRNDRNDNYLSCDRTNWTWHPIKYSPPLGSTQMDLDCQPIKIKKIKLTSEIKYEEKINITNENKVGLN